MLELCPEPEDWHNVLFSDEIYFGWGPEGNVRILRRDGERYNPENIVLKGQPAEKDRRRYHCWAAIGYNFKSKLVFYDNGTPNGKMILQCYHDDILEPAVGN